MVTRITLGRRSRVHRVFCLFFFAENLELTHSNESSIFMVETTGDVECV